VGVLAKVLRRVIADLVGVDVLGLPLEGEEGPSEERPEEGGKREAGRAIVAPRLPLIGVAIVALSPVVRAGELSPLALGVASWATLAAVSGGGAGATGSSFAFEMIVLFSVRQTALSPAFLSL
jgi:hypothetical protein